MWTDPVRLDTRRFRAGLLVLLSSATGIAGGPGLAAPTIERQAPAPARATGSTADREVPMTVTVLPRSKSAGTPDAALVYLDGRIDADAPRRLSEALDG